MMSVFTARSWFARPVDEDWVDRVNGFWTVLLLSMCAAGAFWVRFVTDPITCWFPPHFTSSRSLYALKTCFLQEQFMSANYGVGHGDPVPSYHLWIPIILFFQAVCFFVPNLFWRCLKNRFSIDSGSVVFALENAHPNISSESKAALYQRVAALISNVLRKNNFLLAAIYLGTKVFYCINLLGQFIFLLIYFKHEFVIKAGIKIGIDVSGYTKPLLLKSGLCSYQILEMGKVMSFVSQCVLPISEIYEKLFVFLSYWVLFLLVTTVFSFITWAALLFVPYFRNRKLATYIRAFNSDSQIADEDNITPFISEFLGISGSFMLHSISSSNEMVAAELTSHLFEEFKQRQAQQDARVILSKTKPESELENVAESQMATFTISEKPYVD